MRAVLVAGGGPAQICRSLVADVLVVGEFLQELMDLPLARQYSGHLSMGIDLYADPGGVCVVLSIER